MPAHIPPPDADEYAPYYTDYIQRAAARQDVLAALQLQMDEMHAALASLSDEQSRFKPGMQEWSVKEVVGHIIDVERVFSYRLLRFSRADATPLAGFEDEPYVREAGFDQRTMNDLLDEFTHLRRANYLAVKNMRGDVLLFRGTASNASISVRAIIYILAGHVEHHMASLHEKYLPAL